MLRYLSLFSGIGAFEKALTNLGVNYELVNYCEIDKYASKSYSAIHGISESKNLWDITKVNVFDLPTNIDLLTYGFPCQDISLAGKQKGMFNDDGTLTRSGLFFKALDVIECVKPKIAIAENVKALTSKKFTEEFKIVLDSLEKAGYHNYWKVLNAKDYGIPQNRERVFIVSIRKDIDHNIFEFPKPYSLEKRLKDFLEPHVDEKYYLSDDLISKVVSWKAHQKPFEKVLVNKSISPTLTARGAGENHSGMILYSDTLEDTSNLQNDCLQIREKTKKGYSEAQDGDGVYINRPEQKRGVVQKGMIQTIKTSPDIGVVVKENIDVSNDKSLWTETQAKMITEDLNVKRYIGSDIIDEFKEGQCANINFPNGYGHGNRVSDNCFTITTSSGSNLIVKTKNKRIYKIIEDNDLSDKDPSFLDIYNQKVIHDECGTLKAGMDQSQGNIIYNQLRIRKLTPKECYRLMGFSDEAFEKAKAVPTSNTQLYKQAGNSIVVDVLEEIFLMMLDDEGNLLL